MTYRELIHYLIEMNTDDLDQEANVSFVGLPFSTYKITSVDDADPTIHLVASRSESRGATSATS